MHLVEVIKEIKINHSCIKKLWLIFTLILALSCTEKKQSVINHPVIKHYYHYYNKDSITKSFDLNFDRIVNSNSVSYVYKYKVTRDTFLFQHAYLKGGKKYLHCFNLECPLIAQKEFTVADHQFTVQKYNYDIPTGSDEETNFFFCDDFGLLVADNYTEYGLVYTLEYDSISELLVMKLLNDSTNFGIIK